MGSIVGAMVSSHAYAFVEPDGWDSRRVGRSQVMYEQRTGNVAVERPQVADETLEGNQRRFELWRHSYADIRRRLVELAPDAVIMIGNDQDEAFDEACQPQFAIYTGGDFFATHPPTKRRLLYRAAPAIAEALVEGTLAQNFDTSIVRQFRGDELPSHAHYDAVHFFDPEARQAIIPVYVKTIHPPSPTPRRCYEFGQALRCAIESSPNIGRVVLFSSGGFSHFAPDYPWDEYSGPNSIGSICAEFDRPLVEAMRRGDGAVLAELSSEDLFANGDLELRQTIVMQGALGKAKPLFLHYEPFYRAIMGLAVGVWEFAEH